MFNCDRKIYWEVVCERDGEPYCSSIVEGASEEEALRNFYAESYVASVVQVVGINRIGRSTSALRVMLEHFEERSSR